MYLDTEARKTCKSRNTVLQKINGIYVTAHYYKKILHHVLHFTILIRFITMRIQCSLRFHHFHLSPRFQQIIKKKTPDDLHIWFSHIFSNVHYYFRCSNVLQFSYCPGIYHLGYVTMRHITSL